MGSEYATGEGSSFVSAGKEPGIGGGVGGGVGRGAGTFADGSRRRARAGTANAGMAKAVVNGVREWVGETGEVMGFWRGERTRPF
jgi:hypothetical protein